LDGQSPPANWNQANAGLDWRNMAIEMNSVLGVTN